MFGRYEKHNNSTNEHKFYEIAPTANPSQVAVAWGRIGSIGSGQLISRSEASDRISKKKNDGYQFFSTTVQSATIHKLANQVSGTVKVNVPVSSTVESTPVEPKKPEFSISDWITR